MHRGFLHRPLQRAPRHRNTFLRANGSEYLLERSEHRRALRRSVGIGSRVDGSRRGGVGVGVSHELRFGCRVSCRVGDWENGVAQRVGAECLVQ